MMITKKFIYTLIIASVLINLTFAQSNPKQEAAKLFPKYSLLNQQLEEIHKEALQDEEIARQGQALNNKVFNLMIRTYPEAQDLVEQKAEIEEQFKQEQEAGSDKEKLLELKQQYQNVEKKIEQYRSQIAQRPEIKAESEAFEKKVLAKMREINPETPKMISKVKELKAQMDKLLGKN